jgi:hypothetical protein
MKSTTESSGTIVILNLERRRLTVGRGVAGSPIAGRIDDNVEDIYPRKRFSLCWERGVRTKSK